MFDSMSLHHPYSSAYENEYKTVTIKDWLQKRIDYWEAVIEHTPQPPLDYEGIKEHGYADGILQGFYEAMEYLDGQRR